MTKTPAFTPGSPQKLRRPDGAIVSQPSAVLGVAPVAHVLIRGRQGVFVAETCEIADGLVTATGKTRWRTGANYDDLRWGTRAAFSWPTRAIREIRWLVDEEACPPEPRGQP